MVLDLRFCVHPHSRSGVCGGGGGIVVGVVCTKTGFGYPEEAPKY